MVRDELYNKLNYLDAARKNRLEAAKWVLANPKYFPDLLAFCFKTEDEISFKAAWALEFVCLERLDLLLPHLDYFFKNLSNIKHHSALRTVAKVCELLAIQYYKTRNTLVINSLKENHKEIMTECCFDWLITDKKVACQAHAMLSLYFLGTQINWIHPALKSILIENIPHQSAGYKARARNILKEIS